MADQTYVAKAHKSKSLRKIGVWATAWWAISCIYVFVFLIVAMGEYARNNTESIWSMGGWRQALSTTWQQSGIFKLVLVVLVAGWVIGAIVWLRALKEAGISYKAGLRDLFLTIR